MNNCLNCGKEIVQTQGKRERKFCSPDCKTRHWYKTHPKKKSKYAKFEKLLDINREDNYVMIDWSKSSPELKQAIQSAVEKMKEGKNIPINTEALKNIDYGIAKEERFKENRKYASQKATEAQKSNEKGNEGESKGEESGAENGQQLTDEQKRAHNDELKKLIKEIEARKCPSYMQYPIWLKKKEREIESIKKQLI